MHYMYHHTIAKDVSPHHPPDSHVTMEAFQAAYGLDATTDSGGPQCQSHPDFCFLCSFEPEPSAAGSDDDLYQTIVDLVNDLGEQEKELPLIVQVVHSSFRTNVQSHLVWTNPATGAVVQNPAWSKESIRRHLIHSNQFKFFPSIVRNIFHSIMIKQNACMIDKDTKMVVEEHRKAFIETVDAFRKFENWAATPEAGKKKV